MATSDPQARTTTTSCPLFKGCVAGDSVAPALLDLFIREVINERTGKEAANSSAEVDFVDRAIKNWIHEVPDFDGRDLALRGRITRIDHFFRGIESRFFADFGINGSESQVLFTLRRSGPPYSLSPKNLMESILVVPSAITKIVGHLERLGYVTRKPDLNDRRSVLVQLTTSGHDLVSAVFERLKSHNPFIRNLAPAEYTVLVWLLRKLVLTLEGR